MTYFSKYKKPKQMREATIKFKMPERDIKFPPRILMRLAAVCEKKDITLSLAVLRAIENEFASETPFEHDMGFPTGKYDEDNESLHMTKVYDFINKHPGFTLEWLVFLRDEMNLPDKTELLTALRDLIEKDIIEVYEAKGWNEKSGAEVFRVKESFKRISSEVPLP